MSTKEDTKSLRQKMANLNQILEANNISLGEAQALTHLGSWQWNVQTNEISWSDELYRIYGLKPQEREIGFEEFLRLIHPDDRDRVGGIIGDAYQNGKAFEFEHRIVLGNKNIRVLHGKGKPITDDDGKILRMVGTSQDITDRKKADQALNLSDERFKAVTAATSDLVYDIDLLARTTWFNEIINSEYGYPKDKVGKTQDWWINRIHLEDREGIKAALDELLKSSSTTWVGDYRVKKHDGSYVDVHDRAFILRDTDNKPMRMIGSILDTTQQKQLDRAKDEFISLVSHQLRTPLSVIRTYGEMLTNGLFGPIEPTQNTQISRMTDASIRLIQLVSSMLDVSKLELDRIDVKPVPTDVNALIEQYIAELSSAAAQKGVKISFTPQPVSKKVLLDPIIFSQILQNYLTNSVRYTATDTGRIRVTFTTDNTGHTLSVTDNGIGVPQEAQPQVFERFYRAKNAANIVEHGTGLGLYLVKLLAEACGGKVSFNSIQDKQTTFYFHLPKQGMTAISRTKPV